MAVVVRNGSRRGQAQGVESLNQLCKSVAVAAVLVVFGIGMFSRFYAARFNYLTTTSAMEQGEIAQQLRGGHGFTTRIGRPLGLDKPAGKGAWYDVAYNPLYPLALSIFFRIRGGGDSSVALFNGLVQFAAGLLVYLLGVQLRGPRTGILAVLLYFCGIEAISTALDGTGLTLTAFFVTLGLWLALRTRSGQDSAPGRRGLLWAAFTGVAFGLAYLSGGMSVLLVLPAAVLASGERPRRWAAAGIVLAAFCLVLLPWVGRNLIQTHTLSPRLIQYKLIAFTQTYPAGSIFQELPGRAPDPVSFAFTHPGEMARKFLSGVAVLYRQVPSFLNTYLFPLVLLFGLLAGPGTAGRRLWGTVMAMLLLQSAVACLYDFDAETLRVLLPAGVSLAAAAIAALATAHLQRPMWRAVAVAAALAVVVFPYGASLAIGGDNTREAAVVRGIAPLKAFLASDALVATDVPAAVTWYTGISTVMLPTKIAGVNDLAARGADPDYIYLSARLLMGPPTDWNRRSITEEERRIVGTPLGLSDKNVPPVFERRAKRAPGVQVERRNG